VNATTWTLCLGAAIAAAVVASPAFALDDPAEGAPVSGGSEAAAAEATATADRESDDDAGVAAGGEGAAGGLADAPSRTLRATGFVDSRWTGGYASVARMLSASDVPHLHNLSEGNVQLKLEWAGRGQVQADVSLVWQRGWMYWGADKDAQRVRLADHDVPALRPMAVVAELYAIANVGERLNLTIGKKRVLWGPGLAWNPTDLINPPKDPTDPTLQRAGSWLARIELPLDEWTFSLVGAARATQTFAGLPTGLVWAPDNAPAKADDRPHYLLAARIYRLVADTDLNLLAFHSNLYNDPFENKLRLGVSASRVFFDSVEVHGEVLGQLGSARLYAERDCVLSLGHALACAGRGVSPGGYSKLDDGEPRLKALAGLRWQFGESAAISAEYLYNGDGANPWQFESLVHALALAKTATALGAPLPFAIGATAQDAGTPQKFAFEPLRRHYLFLTYLHPQLADDFTINAVVVLGAHDLSGQLAPQLTWSAREWLNLTVGGFVALPGVESMGAAVGGRRWTEYGLMPPLWRAFVAARAFY